MKIRKFKRNDLVEVANLVKRTYAKYNYKDGSKKAIQGYLNLYDPKKNLKRIKDWFFKDSIFYVAISKNKIIGVVRGNKKRIWNLYVDGSHHRKGIGQKLMAKFEKEAQLQGSKIIHLRSSLFAVPFYEKLDYKKTTGIRKSQLLLNLKYQPMAKKLK